MNVPDCCICKQDGGIMLMSSVHYENRHTLPLMQYVTWCCKCGSVKVTTNGTEESWYIVGSDKCYDSAEKARTAKNEKDCNRN